MKKKIALACLLLSSGVMAQTGTTAYVAPLTHAAPNVPFVIDTSHAYAILNDSGVVQNVAVCMTTTLCYDAAPQYHKIIQSCDNLVIQPGEMKNRINHTTLPFNYPFKGSCDVVATTEAFGWQHSIATSRGRLRVWPI